MFDLLKIKEAVESLFDVELTVRTCASGKEKSCAGRRGMMK